MRMRPRCSAGEGPNAAARLRDSELHAAVVASRRCPHDAWHRVAFVAYIAAAAAVRFVVLGATCDLAVAMNDQSAATGHGLDGSPTDTRALALSSEREVRTEFESAGVADEVARVTQCDGAIDDLA
jgi:hypothetical protein